MGNDRGSFAAGGKRISHISLGLSSSHNSPSPVVVAPVSLLTLHYAPHTTAGSRRKGRVGQESSVEFIAGCFEE